MSSKVVLFSPPYHGPVVGPPLSLLSLAAAVRQGGFQPHIIDGALQPDYMERIQNEIQDCLCFGVSLLTGPMILTAIRAARKVRQLQPELPIIFGGWHPSLLPAQTLREEYIDAIVLHQGEFTLLEIAQRLSERTTLDLVAGCWFKDRGRIRQNQDRPTVSLSKLPSPAYDLVDFDAYEAANGERTLPYASSVGCPYDCSYCTDAVFYNRRFNAYDGRRVAADMAQFTCSFRLRKVALVDSNFLVNTRRALEIARGLIESKTRVEWTFQASTDLLCRMSDSEIETLAESGLTHIGFGTESASREVLLKMNKPHQHVADMYEAARKCRSAGIRITYNLIFGYPGETEADRRETLRVMSDINDRFPNVSFSPNMFTPYPGIPVWPELESLGLKEPQSLAEWGEIDLSSKVLPWLEGEPTARIKRAVAYLLLKSEVSGAARRSRSKAGRLVFTWLGRPLAWRVRNYCFRWPFELRLAVVRRWLIIRRSLLTGKGLSHALDRVC